MAKVAPKAEEVKVDLPQETGRSNVGQTSNKHVSKHFNKNRRPSGTDNTVKIDIQAQPKSPQIKRLKHKDARIVKLVNMLDDKGAITEKEKQWLETLGNEHHEAFYWLENLLHVPKYWRPSQHGVWDKQDRLNIRLQTLKAAVSEAVSTADTDDTDKKKQQTVERALIKAAIVRKALNGKTAGKKLRAYQHVTTATLRNPQALYDKNNSMVMNTLLAQALSKPSRLNSDIENRNEVAKAAQALVANDLLDGPAAGRLLSKLQEQPDQINALMALDDDKIRQQPDRQKVRSLILLALARSPSNVAEAVRNTMHSVLFADDLALNIVGDHLSRKLDPTAELDPLHRPAHEWLHELSLTGGASEDVRNTWHAWADGKVVDDSRPDVLHQDHELDMKTFLLEEPGVVRVLPKLEEDNII